MDIVTHAMMGTIAASPFLESHPEAATAFAFGSVLPDLDVLSRLFGRRAFLRFHQTTSHALPVIAAIGLAGSVGLWLCGSASTYVALALASGMAFHSLLDWTNTYGITLLAPFTRRRFCREWVFFIDAVVLAASAAVLIALAVRLRHGEPLGHELQLGYGIAMLAYWIAKIGLRGRAWRQCPGTPLSLLPSALVPWRFLGCRREGGEIHIFTLDALSGAIGENERLPILDPEYAGLLEELPEVRSMRELSPAYHLVEKREQDDGIRLVCRDLRTRNFKTRFGQLDLLLSPSGQVLHRVFHV